MTGSFSVSPQDGAVRCGRVRLAWRLAAARTAGEPLTYIKPEDMAGFRVEEGGRLRTVWRGHPLLGADFEVAVDWRPGDGKNLFSGSLAWQGNTSDFFIEEIAFPLLSAKMDENSRFLLPANLGELVTMRGVPQKPKRTYYASMQWTALFPAGKKHGYYLDCRDPEHRIKQFDYAYGDGVFFHSPVHFVPLTEENAKNFTLPYFCTFGRFRGSWYEGAMIYRAWALKQPWVLNRRPPSPKLRNIAMWVWNRGTEEEVIPPAEQLQKDADAPVALDWYWWHSNPYDTDYPEFWPPRSGAEKFGNAVSRLNARGIFTQVYTNGMTWDMDTASFAEDHGKRSLQINRDGTPTAMMFNPYTRHRLAIMCGEAPEFHEKMLALAGKLAGCGLPGLYLDMIGSFAFSPCFNAHHRHVKGGGTYQKDGYYAFVSAVRAAHPELLLSTEYASEMMDLFDSFIMLDTSLERCYGSPETEAVPAYTAVYHGMTTLFGSYAIPDGVPPWDPRWPDRGRRFRERQWHRRFRHQFFVELARCIVWGVQPCVCNLKKVHAADPEFADEYAFILRVAAFRRDHGELLDTWRLLSPGEFHCKEIKVRFMKRGIFTRPEEMTVTERLLPAVLHSFREGPAGEKALVLVNYTRRRRLCRYRDGRRRLVPVTVPPLSCLCVMLEKSRSESYIKDITETTGELLS